MKWFRSQKQITQHTWSKSSSSCSFSSLSSSLSSASKSSSLALSALSCFLDELAVRTCLISSTMLRTCFSSRCDPETWKQMPASFSLKQHLKENWWLKKYNKQNHWDFRTAQYSTPQPNYVILPIHIYPEKYYFLIVTWTFSKESFTNNNKSKWSNTSIIFFIPSLSLCDRFLEIMI